MILVTSKGVFCPTQYLWIFRRTLLYSSEVQGHECKPPGNLSTSTMAGQLTQKLSEKPLEIVWSKNVNAAMTLPSIFSKTKVEEIISSALEDDMNMDLEDIEESIAIFRALFG